MNERTTVVVIPKDEYTALIENAERVALIGRLLNNGNYISVEELYLILNIERGSNGDDDSKPKGA